MIDPSKIAQYDQDTTFLNELLPSVARSFYVACLAQGFTSQESLVLTESYLRRLMG